MRAKDRHKMVSYFFAVPYLLRAKFVNALTSPPKKNLPPPLEKMKFFRAVGADFFWGGMLMHSPRVYLKSNKLSTPGVLEKINPSAREAMMGRPKTCALASIKSKKSLPEMGVLGACAVGS